MKKFICEKFKLSCVVNFFLWDFEGSVVIVVVSCNVCI